jgi:hypothetical protein
MSTDIQDIEVRVKRAEWWMIWLTFAIAFFGLCSVIVAYMQWQEIHSGSTDTHDLAVAAKTQADKMKNMSEAAEKIRKAAEDMVIQDQKIADISKLALEASNRQSRAALDFSIKSSRNDQRAWVGTGSNTISIAGDGQGKLELLLINTGRTPALETEAAMGWVVGPVSGVVPAPTGPPGNPTYTFFPQGTFAPQSQHPVSVTVSFPPQIISEVNAGIRPLIYYGVIRYRDIYGIKAIHETHWCLAFTPGESSMRVCMKGNDMN